MAVVLNARGTSVSSFGVGKQGPLLNKNGNSLEIKDSSNTNVVVEFDTTTLETVIDRNLGDSGIPLQVIQNHTSATGDVVALGNDGTGDSLKIVNTNNARGIFIDNNNSTLSAIEVEITGTGNALKVNTDKFTLDKDGNTSQKGSITVGDVIEDAVILAYDAPASSNSAGKQIILSSGHGDGTGSGGNVTISAGNGGNTNANGGNIYLTPGEKSGSGTDGTVIIGNPSVDGTSISGQDAVVLNSAGGYLNFIGGSGNGTGSGGDIIITGGAAGASNANGGNIVLEPGQGTGSGVDGYIKASVGYDMSAGPDEALATKEYVNSISGSYNYLGQIDLTGQSSVDFETNVENYNSIEMFLYALQPGTDSAEIFLRMKVGGSYLTTGYYYTSFNRSGGVFRTSEDNDATLIQLWRADDVGNTEDEETTGKLILVNTAKVVSGTRFGLTGTTEARRNVGTDLMLSTIGAHNSTDGIVQGIRFAVDTGTFARGIIRFFGVN